MRAAFIGFVVAFGMALLLGSLTVGRAPVSSELTLLIGAAGLAIGVLAGFGLGLNTERPRRSNRELPGAVLHRLPYPVFWKDRNSMYLGCNPSFAAIAGLPDANDIVGRTDFEMPWSREEAEGYRADDAEVMGSGRSKLHIIETLHDAAGEESWLDTSKVPLMDAQGNAYGLLGIFNDITALKRAEASLVVARDEAEAANRAKTRFLAGMSHELRTPLNVIIGYAELMSEEAQSGLAPVEDLDKVLDQANHLLRLVNDLLDLARVESGAVAIDMVPTSVRPIVETVVRSCQPLATARNNLLTMRGDGDPVAMADPSRLQQVLLNLVANACKFTRDGRITVEIEDGHPHLQVRVRDTGRGMSDDERASVFDAFVQADGVHQELGGSGLGLTISRELAQRMGGNLDVRSEPEQGSCFTVTLVKPDQRRAAG